MFPHLLFLRVLSTLSLYLPVLRPTKMNYVPTTQWAQYPFVPSYPLLFVKRKMLLKLSKNTPLKWDTRIDNRLKDTLGNNFRQPGFCATGRIHSTLYHFLISGWDINAYPRSATILLGASTKRFQELTVKSHFESRSFSNESSTLGQKLQDLRIHIINSNSYLSQGITASCPVWEKKGWRAPRYCSILVWAGKWKRWERCGVTGKCEICGCWTRRQAQGPSGEWEEDENGEGEIHVGRCENGYVARI